MYYDLCIDEPDFAHAYVLYIWWCYSYVRLCGLLFVLP